MPTAPTSPRLAGVSSCREAAVPELETVADVDACLARAAKIPESERTEMWYVVTDSLLERRRELEAQCPVR